MCLALPALVVALLPGSLALIELGGVRREISLALLDDVVPGDYVIVHAGYALTRLDPEEAQHTLALFAAAGDGPATLTEPDGPSGPSGSSGSSAAQGQGA